MMFRHEYKNPTERLSLLDANKDKFLVEEQFITEGNFLIFSDNKPLESGIEELRTENMILMMSLADIYTEVQSLKGGV